MPWQDLQALKFKYMYMRLTYTVNNLQYFDQTSNEILNFLDII